jgi:uncharacterized membrane protein
MANGFSGPVAQIVDNYLERLKKGLRGIPARDQDELVKEINSHIYESFRSETSGDEVSRILRVLDKLGEPAAVISARMPEAMMTLGKKRRLPFLILAGLLIAFFGVPLGLGGLSAAIGLIIGLLALVVSFYAVAFSLILTGWLSAVFMIVRIFSPGFLDRWIDIYPLVPDPTFNTVIYIVGALLIAAVGFGLLWLGSRLMRGMRFVFRLLFGKIRNWRRRAPASAGVQP